MLGARHSDSRAQPKALSRRKAELCNNLPHAVYERACRACASCKWPTCFLWHMLIENEWLNVKGTKFIALKAFSHALCIMYVHKIISGKLPSRKLYIFFSSKQNHKSYKYYIVYVWIVLLELDTENQRPGALSETGYGQTCGAIVG